MVQINFALKEVNCKIVYYGPGMSGKTTNLEIVHQKAPTDRKGELTAIATEGDRTLFFDFLPLDLGKVSGMTTRFQLYTVPGQVYYNSTRKLVLQGADGVIFVADSADDKMDENLESISNLEENLRDYGMNIMEIPMVIQYNKRDLPNAMTVPDLEAKLNRFNAPHYEAVATTGQGVFPTLKKLSALVLERLNDKPAAKAKVGPKPGPGAPAPKAAEPKPAAAKPGPPAPRPGAKRPAAGRPTPGKRPPSRPGRPPGPQKPTGPARPVAKPGPGRPPSRRIPAPGHRPGAGPPSGRQRPALPEQKSSKGLMIGVIVGIGLLVVVVVLYAMDML